MDEKGSYSVKQKSQMDCELLVEKSDSTADESDHNVDDAGPDEDVGLQGELVGLTLESGTRPTAYGTVIPSSGPHPLQHGKPLPKDCMRVSIDQALDADAKLPVPGECESVGEVVRSHVAWPKHLIQRKSEAKKKKCCVEPQCPTVDSSTVSKTLHMLYCYVKLALQHKGNVMLCLPHDVVGRDIKVYVNIEDIVPFCQLMPISYTCIIVYIWYLYKRVAAENKLDRFKFVYPYDIGHIPSTKANDNSYLENEMDWRARALASRLNGTLPIQLVLAPCNVRYHWILTVIDPHREIAYLLDPLYRRLQDKIRKKLWIWHYECLMRKFKRTEESNLHGKY